MQANYTISEENYLKSVYHLQQQGNKVTTGELSRHLHTKPASVTDMMKKLQLKKLLIYTPYHGFRLSKAGSTAAVNIIRRHRLWEFFLAEKLNFGWDEVHEMAEHLEHISDPRLIDKLDAFLNYPRFDPHGDPIPDKNGNMIYEKRLKLQDAAPGTAADICAVTRQDNVLLEMMLQKGLQIGTRVEVKKRFEYDNSVELKINGGRTIHISDKMAGEILCKPVKHKRS